MTTTTPILPEKFWVMGSRSKFSPQLQLHLVHLRGDAPATAEPREAHCPGSLLTYVDASLDALQPKKKTAGKTTCKSRFSWLEIRLWISLLRDDWRLLGGEEFVRRLLDRVSRVLLSRER